MYSDMSIAISASASPNMNSARALLSSVLPTPLGPRNRNEPIGRFGSLRPLRARRIVLLMALMASSWDTTRLCSSFSSSSSRWASSFSSRVSGTPVIFEITSAMTSSSTTPSTSLAFSRHCFCISSFLARRASAWSRRRAASSYSALRTASSFWMRQPLDLLFQLRQVRRLGHAAEADAGPGLVDGVDRLVGQGPAGDVPVGQLHGRHQGRVQDLHAVVGLVPVAEALEDLDRVGLVRRVDGDRLEPAGQGVVLLDVLAVLVEGGGPDALDLAAAQGGLEHVARRRWPPRPRRHRPACAARR